MFTSITKIRHYRLIVIIPAIGLLSILAAMFTQAQEVLDIEEQFRVGAEQALKGWLQKDMSQAIPQLEKVLRLAKTDDEQLKIKAVLGWSYLRAGEPLKAIAMFEWCINYDPTFIIVLSEAPGKLIAGSFRYPNGKNADKAEAGAAMWQWMLKVLHELGMMEMQAMVEQKLSKPPKWVGLFIDPIGRLGDAYKDAGDLEKAIKAWELALVYMPEADAIGSALWFYRARLAAAGNLKGDPIVFIGHRPLIEPVHPRIDKNYTLVELESLAKALKLSCLWKAKHRVARLSDKDKTLEINLGSKEAYLNNRKARFPMAPKLMDRCLMVPLRLVAEAFGYKVQWDEKPRIAVVYAPFSSKHR